MEALEITNVEIICNEEDQVLQILVNKKKQKTLLNGAKKNETIEEMISGSKSGNWKGIFKELTKRYRTQKVSVDFIGNKEVFSKLEKEAKNHEKIILNFNDKRKRACSTAQHA